MAAIVLSGHNTAGEVFLTGDPKRATKSTSDSSQEYSTRRKSTAQGIGRQLRSASKTPCAKRHPPEQQPSSLWPYTTFPPPIRTADPSPNNSYRDMKPKAQRAQRTAKDEGLLDKEVG